MREIYRTIASALIFSKDNKLLLGRKDPNAGGVYPNCWHIPWWWVEEGENLLDAVKREVLEEVWLDISECEPVFLSDFVEQWISEKTLSTGEKVVCHMKFNRFKVLLSENAEDIELTLWDDLVEVQWFSAAEAMKIQHVPWGKELLQNIWFLQ